MPDFDLRNFNGITQGFEYTKTFHWEYYDVTGYAGYHDDRKTIYVVMRGTNSQPNADMDNDMNLTAYTTWPECNCRVHRGIDRGVNGVYPQILEEVQRLQALKPDYTIEVNGHSLGGALA